jgi:hypothetical protein
MILMTEYAFDVKLFAVLRVEASNVHEAKLHASNVLDAMDIDNNFIEGYNERCDKGVKISEVSLSQDGGMWLFEVDGEDTDEPFNAPG